MPILVQKTNKGMRNFGGCYRCVNMKKAPGSTGVHSDYTLTNDAVKTAATTTANLGVIDKWLERTDNNVTTYWAKDNGSRIFVKISSTYFQAFDSAGAGSGFLVDFGNEIIDVGARYIGRTSTSTLDGALASAANTCDVIDASGFPSSGEAIISDGNSSERISYTGKTVNQLTGVTRGENNTTDGTHDSGDTIIAMDTQWKDMTASGDGGPAIKFQDYILVSNGVKVAGWTAVDGTDFTTQLPLATNDFAIPANYDVVDFSLITTGAGERVLIAANKDQESATFIWDAVSADWDKAIYFRENIAKLEAEFVAMESGIYRTDGYNMVLLAELPDDERDMSSSDLRVVDIKRKGNLLMMTANNAQFDRNRSGVWILDLEELDWFFINPSNSGAYNRTFGALFISTSWSIFVSHNFNGGAVDILTTAPSKKGNIYQMVFDPQTTRVQRLNNVKLNLDLKLKNIVNDFDFNFDVIVRYYNYSKVFLQTSVISGVSANTSQIVLTEANQGLPAVGDRIEIVQRDTVATPDCAGEVRNITAVATAAGKHTCTLDEALSTKPLAASANDSVTLNPLIKIAKKSFTGRTINFLDLRFDATGHPEFKKIMIEVEFRNNNSNEAQVTAPGLNYMEIDFQPAGNR